MKVLLCYVFSTFCIIIVASGRPKIQITMDGPFEACADLENPKVIINDLKFTQVSSDDFTLNGKYIIKETINGPINLRIISKKYERGTWVNSMLNQNINDLCTEMEKEKRPEWMKMFSEWTSDNKCPFVEKEGEYKDFVTFNSKNAPELLPPNFYGKYRSEARLYQNVNGDMNEFGCFIVDFDIASV